MAERRDKLGRRIPEFDRVAAGKKTAAKNKEKDEDYYIKLGAIGGKHRTRGYFGKLKDEGKTEELREVSSRNNVGYFQTLKKQGKTEELKKIAQKGQAASAETIRSRRNKSVSGGQS